jgi:small-conductance mechanosensitive channel
MRLLALLVVLAAAALVAWRFMRGRLDDGPRSRGLADLAAAVLALVLLAAAFYSAHLLGIFSVPLVAVAFVPFGVVARWLLLASRSSRRRKELDGRATAPGPGPGLRLPLLLVLVVAVAVLGVVLGTIIGPH